MMTNAAKIQVINKVFEYLQFTIIVERSDQLHTLCDGGVEPELKSARLYVPPFIRNTSLSMVCAGNAAGNTTATLVIPAI